jgi:hypothetical protein
VRVFALGDARKADDDLRVVALLPQQAEENKRGDEAGWPSLPQVEAAVDRPRQERGGETEPGAAGRPPETAHDHGQRLSEKHHADVEEARPDSHRQRRLAG